MSKKKSFEEEMDTPAQDGALEQAKKTGKLKLLDPVEWGEETIAHLEFRKAKGKDFRRLPMEPTTGDIMDLTAKLTQQAPGLIDELSARDLMNAMEVTSYFLGVGPGTGKTF